MNDQKNAPAVLITGASGGIGGAIAREFARDGYRLYIAGKSHADKLKDLAAELSESYFVPCVPLIFDAADGASVDAAFEGISSLDGLVNCAGIAHFSLIQETDDADWSRVIEVNLGGAFRVIKRAVPLLLRSGDAHILNISSVWGERGAALESAYSASKGGLDALTRSVALELAPSGVAVNAIACGVIDTKMNREHLSEEELEALREEIPVGRIASPEEVARFALQIMKAPSYLTGQVIAFSGGWRC